MPPSLQPPVARRPSPRRRRRRRYDPLLTGLRALVPLVAAVVLAGLGAGAWAVMGPSTTGAPYPLDLAGNLVNASTPRRQTSPLGVPVTPAPDASCPRLSRAAVDEVCVELEAGRVENLAGGRAARKLPFCDMFDYRTVLGFAGTLEAARGLDCQALVAGAPNASSVCRPCLDALLAWDNVTRERVRVQTAVMDKYQCRVGAPPGKRPLLASSTASPNLASRSTAANAATAAGREEGDRMTPQTHAGSSNCRACEVAYKRWMCSVMFEVRPFATREGWSETARAQRVPACDSWCATVETECPYFAPAEDQQNGGEPLFLCREAHYHDSSLYPMSTVPCGAGSHRHSCCYTLEDIACRPGANSSTCPALEEVCLRTVSRSGPFAVPPAATSPPNASSDLLPQQTRQSQYSPPADANASVLAAATNDSSVASSARRTRVLDAEPRLLLLLVVAYCCAAVLELLT